MSKLSKRSETANDPGHYDPGKTLEIAISVPTHLQYDFESASSGGFESGRNDQTQLLRECVPEVTS